MADGKIVFETRIDNSGIEKGLRRIKELFQKEMGSIAGESVAIGDEIEAAFSKIDVTKPIENALRKIENLKSKIATVESDLDRVSESGQTDTGHKNVAAMVAQQEKLYEQLGAARQKLSADVAAAAQEQAAAEEAAAQRERAALSAQYSFKDFLSGAKDLTALEASFARTAEKVKSFWQKAGNAISSILSKTFAPIKSIGSMISSAWGKMRTSNGALSKSFGNVLSSIKRIGPALLAARGIMGILRNAVNAYMQANEECANTISNAWAGLGNLLGPIITRITNLVASAVSYFTQFLNLLGITGKTAAKQIGSAGSSAKKETDKLKKQLMSFDELNVLSNTEESSGGGSGSGTGDLPNVALPDWVQLMAEQLKAAQWSEAANTLTTALNEMVAGVDWTGVGTKIGYALNGALEFLATAILTFNWFVLGADLGTGINSLIGSVDWTNLGVILGAKFKILIEGLGGLFSTLDWVGIGYALSDAFKGLWNSIDWQQAGTTLSDGIKGVLSTITTAIQEVNWQQVGNDIALFLSSIDWAGIVNGVFDLLCTLVGSALDLLWGTVEDYFDDYIKWAEEEGLSVADGIVVGLLTGIVEALANIGTWIVENIFNPFMDAFKNAFGIHSPSTVMAEQGGFLMSGLLNGITEKWGNIKSFISQALSDIKDGFKNAWQAVSETTSSIWNGIVSSIKGAVNGVISVINRMIATVVDGVNSLFRLLSFNIDIPGVGNVGWSLPQFSTPQIPYLAQGAVIPPNAPFMAVLGDQKNGTNLEVPDKLVRQIVREEVTAGLSQMGGGDIQINFTGDLAQLAKILYPEIHRQDRNTARVRGW